MINQGLQRQIDQRTDLSPVHPDFSTAATVHSLSLGRAACIVAQQNHARAFLALLGDKEFLFSASGNAFLMYRKSGRCFVAMGDPVGPEHEWPELVTRFSALAEANKGWPVFYQVESNALAVYEDEGLSCMKIGEEARIRLTEFSMTGGKKSRLRQTLRRTERTGATFEIIAARAASSVMQELREVSDAWLANKNTREKGFSLGAFEPSYLQRCPIAIVRQENKIVAFASIWSGSAGSEMAVDLMRYSTSAPDGVMEYLFIKLLLWGQEQGYENFNLGMAPLAGLDRQAAKSFWEIAGAAVFKHGERFYNFRGVRDYKAKFSPNWESRYLVSPGGIRFPLSIAAVSSLIAGGARGLIAR